MTKRPRRNHSPSFKAKVAIAAIKGDKTLAELAHQILAWRDNVFVERLWRTIKYEEVNLRAYTGVPEARASIGRYLSFYNGRRPHSSLGGENPRPGIHQHGDANPGGRLKWAAHPLR